MSTGTFTFRVDGMHSGICALLVDDTLRDIPGVLTSETSHVCAQATLELVTDRTTTVEVIAAIEALGYHAELLS